MTSLTLTLIVCQCRVGKALKTSLPQLPLPCCVVPTQPLLLLSHVAPHTRFLPSSQNDFSRYCEPHEAVFGQMPTLHAYLLHRERADVARMPKTLSAKHGCVPLGVLKPRPLAFIIFHQFFMLSGTCCSLQFDKMRNAIEFLPFQLIDSSAGCPETGALVPDTPRIIHPLGLNLGCHPSAICSVSGKTLTKAPRPRRSGLHQSHDQHGREAMGSKRARAR